MPTRRKNQKTSDVTNTDAAQQTDIDRNISSDTSVGGRSAGGTVGAGGVSTTDVGGMPMTDSDSIVRNNNNDRVDEDDRNDTLDR